MYQHHPYHSPWVVVSRVLLALMGVAVVVGLGWLIYTNIQPSPASQVGHRSDQGAIMVKRYALFERPTVVVIMDDGTGSYGFYDSSLQIIAPPPDGPFIDHGIVGKLTKGCVISMVMIVDKADPNNVILPATEVAYSEFNPNVKTESLRAIVDKIQSLKSPQTQGTDIYGALFQATEVFSDVQYAGFDKRLYIFSDLADTEGRSFPIDLTGVDVTVLFFSSDLEPEKSNVQKPDKEVWLRQFSDWGAKSANIIEAINSQNASL